MKLDITESLLYIWVVVENLHELQKRSREFFRKTFSHFARVERLSVQFLRREMTIHDPRLIPDVLKSSSTDRSHTDRK